MRLNLYLKTTTRTTLPVILTALLSMMVCTALGSTNLMFLRAKEAIVMFQQL